MGWGGGAGFGPPIGGGGRPGEPVGGLPFAGIPSELQDGVDRLLKQEPENLDHESISFSHTPESNQDTKLTLQKLLGRYPRLLIGSGIYVAILAAASQAGPDLTQYAINDGIIRKDFLTVLVISGMYVASVLIAGVAQRYLVKITGRLASEVMHDLRIKVFVHIQRLSMDYFTDEKAGVIMTRMTSDIENLQQLVQDGLAQFAVQGLTMIIIMVILFTKNWQLAIITIALTVPLLVAATLWFRTASERGYSRVRDGIAFVMTDLAESLHGIRVLTAFNRQMHNVIHHRNIVGEYRDANYNTAQSNAVYAPGTQLLGTLGQAALLAIGGEMVLHHHLTIGALVAFFLYLGRFFQPIQLLVQQYNSFQQSQSSILKLRTLFETHPKVLEHPTAQDLPPINGEIVFSHVSFSYDNEMEVLSDITLSIAPGETVAFVGPTGAGKSTIAKLATRFYDPTSGHILVDGHDLESVTLKSLRRQLGVVPQEPFLFAGTIRDNIGFARPEIENSLVDEAVSAVGLSELIDRLPEGLDTFVHERGQSLSSGERQLIALARAFVAQPRVLVLDEATSNLDLQSETKIENALDALLEERTAILIAHRLSTAMKADRIVVVNDGKIAETGTHAALVESGGVYSEMYSTWIKHLGSEEQSSNGSHSNAVQAGS